MKSNHPTFNALVRRAFSAATLACLVAGPCQAKTAAAAPQLALASTCQWDRPGENPFMGDVVSAVDRYRDIPPEVRERLKARMLKREYDDLVSIRRDSITGGRGTYGNTIHDMHFGTDHVCHSVSRAAWSSTMQERGLVYCESGQCILVPTVCRNVSRISRAEVAHERAEGLRDAAAETAAGTDAGAWDFAGAAAGPLGLALAASPGFASSPEGSGGGAVGAPAGSFGAASGALVHGLAAGPAAADHMSFVSPSGSGAQFTAAVGPIPEPQTWVLMLGGLGASLAWRRRLAARRVNGGPAITARAAG